MSMATWLNAYHRTLKVVLTVLMGALILPVSLQIISRYTWTEEVARFCFVWIIMIGSMIAVRDRAHFEVDVLPAPKTTKGRGWSRLVVHVGMLLMALAFMRYGYDFALFGFQQNSEMSGINMLSIYIAFPLAGVTWTLFLIEKLRADWALIQGTAEEADS